MAPHFNSGPYRSSQTIKEIIVKDIPDLKYKLVLFVGSEPIELQRKDSLTWIPVHCPYVLRLPTTYTHRSLCIYRDISPTSRVDVEIFFFFFFFLRPVTNGVTVFPEV